MLRFAALLALGACGPGVSSTNVGNNGEFEDDSDTVAPVIDHVAVSETQPFGVDVTIEATITDEGVGILLANLYYKSEIDGSSDWKQRALTTAGDDLYTGTIRGEDEHGGGMDYYLEAVDKAQNTAFAPEDGEGDAYHFRLSEE